MFLYIVTLLFCSFCFRLVFIISECWLVVAGIVSVRRIGDRIYVGYIYIYIWNDTPADKKSQSKDGGRSRNENVKWNKRKRESISLFSLSSCYIYFNAERLRRRRSRRRRRLRRFFQRTDGINCVVCAHARLDGAQPVSLCSALLRFIYFILSWWKKVEKREELRIPNDIAFFSSLFFSSRLFSSRFFFLLLFIVNLLLLLLHISTQWASILRPMFVRSVAKSRSIHV